MGYLSFFTAALATCLLWTGASTAAAARCRRPWLRRLLLTLALLAPVLAIMPWLAASSLFAFATQLRPHWFGPTLTLFLSALIGGLCIIRAGVQPQGGGWPTVPAARWPVIGLFAMFLLAKAVTGGILLILDNVVAAQATPLKIEAAGLIDANLSPPVPDADNAARLYEAAFSLIDGDPSLSQAGSVLPQSGTIDPTTPAVTELLDRHAVTLAVLRDAVARDTCRFTRDWTRPSFDMLLPEMTSLRQAARLLQLAARRAAGEGRRQEALADVNRIARMGRHAASEPLLMSGLVGLAIDSMAWTTLAGVLPQLTQTDLPLLEKSPFRDLLMSSPSLRQNLFGEEAFGLQTFASFCDASLGADAWQQMLDMGSPPAAKVAPVAAAGMMMYRVFLLPEDLAAYRVGMRNQQQIAARDDSYPEKKRDFDTWEAGLNTTRTGLFTSLVLPAISGAHRAEVRCRAVHHAAQAAVAATRLRIEEERPPEDLATLVPRFLPFVPEDPFTEHQPLRCSVTANALMIYSVGPNGQDDGGPPPPGADGDQGNDDVGLRLLLP
jgi:hypothetical protein